MINVVVVIIISMVMFLVGFATSITNNIPTDAVNIAISECEKSLPRDQVCTWQVVATPKEVRR